MCILWQDYLVKSFLSRRVGPKVNVPKQKRVDGQEVWSKLGRDVPSHESL